MIVRVWDLLRSPFAITWADGDSLYKVIHPHLLAGNPVEVDFSCMEVVTAVFANAAFGRLFADIPAFDIASLLRVISMSDAGKDTMRLVLHNAKNYYTNANTRTAVDATLEQYWAGFS